MKGWALVTAGQPLEPVERADPVPGPGQAVIDVRGAGLCHSDVGFMNGKLTAMLPALPMILGHEVAGTVAAIGAGVTTVGIGDRVVANGPPDFAPGWRVDGSYAAKCLMMAAGELAIEASSIGFDDIPEELRRPEEGGVVGRVVAEMA